MKNLMWMFLGVALLAWVPAAQAQDVQPMYGGWLIDGYDFQKETVGPKGSIVFDRAKNQFVGFYNGLKMPPGRRAIFAWVHDTVNQKSTYIGAVGWLKKGTAGKAKGRFVVNLPHRFRNGNFGSNEILGFTAETTGLISGDKVTKRPSEPAGSAIQKSLKPAFYLFAKLPGADTELHYCGHGQDFFYAKAPEKQTCYD